jgi:hypothetical protein
MAESGSGGVDAGRVLRGAFAGAIGGVAGALVMNQFQRLAGALGDGRESRDATGGFPRSGRGPQPAQALGDPANDATARVAGAVVEAAGGAPLRREDRAQGGRVVHLAFGAANGFVYGAAAEEYPAATVGAGIPFGIGVWAFADEGIVPALGLSRGPSEASAGLLAYGLISHCLYGLTTECVRRALRGGERRFDGASPRRQRSRSA